MSQTILVYGATGPQGRPVAERLLAAGHRVRVLARKPAAASALAAKGAQVVEGDLTRPETLLAASRGVDAISLFVPFLDPNPDYGLAALEAARTAGVRRIVWNPTGPIPPASTGNPGMDVRRIVFEKLSVPGAFDYVVLQPTAYLENFLMPALVAELRKTSTFAYPMPPTSAMQWICHDDVAQFAVEAFNRPTVKNTVFDVSGPESLTGDQIAVRMTAGLGRPIEFRAMPPAEFGSVLDAAYGPGAGARVVPFYEALFASPALFSSSVDLSIALEALPVKSTNVEQWSRTHASLLSPL
ncbi:MAG: NmrA family NAD(P)-binding protein [Deltaproteobacteria bacterium]|nr:NmrA family NAD(P)-binding protein [Deltaproteobacteria bacterium]